MENNQDLIFDLSCLQGQIADVGIGLQGLETQRLLNSSLYVNGTDDDRKDTKLFIHDLMTLLETIESADTGMNKGLATFYISSFLFDAMMTLNKFVNEVTYGDGFEIEFDRPLGGVRPFNRTFSQDLYRLIKKGKIIQTKNDTKHGEGFNINFNQNVTNSFKFTTRDDLLAQNFFIENGELVNYISNDENSYQVVIPETFLISDPDFGNNMRKLITDLYKEYYYYEIVDIQKRLNQKDKKVTNLDTNLRILLQETRNAFTREIYNPNTDVSTEFPLSTIITELNDFINEIDPKAIDDYKDSLYLFDDDQNKNQNNLSLFSFIEEKSHMLNYTGNAYHYALEMCKRIQRMTDYTNDKEDNSLGPNPHFNDINDFTEDSCIRGIDEGLAILSNLTNDLTLLTDDNLDTSSNITNSDFNQNLNKIEDIYHEYLNRVADSNDFVFKGDEIDFNSKQLDSLGIIPILKTANLFNYDTDKAYIYNENEFTEGHNFDNPEDYKTQIYYKGITVSRYGNIHLYHNFSLIVIKIAISLTILYIFRLIQFFNYLKLQKESLSLRNNKNNEIDRLLSQELPNNLTITDYTTIKRLKRKLEEMTKQLHRDNQNGFDLPNDTNASMNNNKIAIEDSLAVCYTNILEIMNNQVNKPVYKLTDSMFIDNTFGRLYPFTKAMLYQYDEYFSADASGDYNEHNDSGSLEIKFGTILNGLNYVAQSIARDKSNDYKVKDMEKLLTKIIYLCTCLTVNWSDLDKITTNKIENITKEESPMSDIMELQYVGDYGLFTNKPINMDKQSGLQQTTVFKTTILGFIYGEMKAIVNSDLQWVVKYVYWLSLYCINSYFIHLLKKDITQVVTSAIV